MADCSEDRPTIHGGNVYQAARRWGVSTQEVIDFSANINPVGPPSGVTQALMRESSVLESYPDSSEFIAALSARLGIGPESVVLGNGSTALIFAAVRALRPARALLLEPAFGEYRRALRASGVQIDAFIVHERDRFLPDFSKLQTALRLKYSDVVFINNPHNPSGALYSADELKSLACAAALGETFLVIDEAFIDYAPEASILPDAAEWPNVVVLRSLTKFYAIPGLRIGYAVCRPELAARLREQIEAWPVSSVALVAAQAAISDSLYEESARRQNEVARTQFASVLSELNGITVFPSAANFILIKLANRSGSELAHWLEQRRVLIRCCDSFVGLGDSFVRLAVRSPEDNIRLAQLIEQWLGLKRVAGGF